MGEMKCFVISPIGGEQSETRKNANDLYEHIVTPALEPVGYSIERADLISESGVITSQIIERIVGSDLVVADLSGHNANVFYELAVRHVTGKPFIHMITEGEPIPFDVAASRTIFYSLDLNGAKKAKVELESQARAFLNGDCKIESPISVALDLKALLSSDDPVSVALGRIENDLSKIRSTSHDMLQRLQFLYNEKRNLAPDTREHLYSGTWTDERVELMKTMWESGSSASEISKALGGVSRNAVIGKIHRLGLGDRPGNNE
jgi:hypothetical protein